MSARRGQRGSPLQLRWTSCLSCFGGRWAAAARRAPGRHRLPPRLPEHLLRGRAPRRAHGCVRACGPRRPSPSSPSGTRPEQNTWRPEGRAVDRDDHLLDAEPVGEHRDMPPIGTERGHCSRPDRRAGDPSRQRHRYLSSTMRADGSGFTSRHRVAGTVAAPVLSSCISCSRRGGVGLLHGRVFVASRSISGRFTSPGLAGRAGEALFLLVLPIFVGLRACSRRPACARGRVPGHLAHSAHGRDRVTV